MLHPNLLTFLTVAKYGSFSKAAEKLFLTPASIMNRMNQLEGTIGVKLFARTTHGIKLTTEGEFFAREAEALSNHAGDILQKIGAMTKKEEVPTLRIGTSIFYSCKLFFDFWQTRGSVAQTFKFQIVPFEDVAENVLPFLDALGTEIDFVVGLYDSKFWHKHAGVLPLGESSIAVAIPREHPLAAKQEISLDDMIGYGLAISKSGSVAAVDKIRQKILNEYPGIKIFDTHYFYDMKVFNICHKRGYLILSNDIWQDIHPAFVTRPLTENTKFPYGIIYANSPTKAVQDFIATVSSML